MKKTIKINNKLKKSNRIIISIRKIMKKTIKINKKYKKSNKIIIFIRK